MEGPEPFGGSPSSASAPSDHRRSPRRRVLKAALIVFRNGHCTMGCLILDTSDTGALLKLADILSCPAEFVLKPGIGPSHDCEVVWGKGATLGVRYL
jgi:hypothetical protein